jgi:hypothetical protein
LATVLFPVEENPSIAIIMGLEASYERKLVQSACHMVDG